MRAGILHESVVIQSRTLSKDSGGYDVESWATHATVFASIEPLRGQEYLEARQVQADVDARIRMRYLSTVKPTMRVVWGSRTFDIISVIHSGERRRETQLMVKEQING